MDWFSLPLTAITLKTDQLTDQSPLFLSFLTLFDHAYSKIEHQTFQYSEKDASLDSFPERHIWPSPPSPLEAFSYNSPERGPPARCVKAYFQTETFQYIVTLTMTFAAYIPSSRAIPAFLTRTVSTHCYVTVKSAHVSGLQQHEVSENIVVKTLS